MNKIFDVCSFIENNIKGGKELEKPVTTTATGQSFSLHYGSLTVTTFVEPEMEWVTRA